MQAVKNNPSIITQPNTQDSIASKSQKKASKADFMNFLENLGKTTTKEPTSKNELASKKEIENKSLKTNIKNIDKKENALSDNIVLDGKAGQNKAQANQKSPLGEMLKTSYEPKNSSEFKKTLTNSADSTTAPLFDTSIKDTKNIKENPLNIAQKAPTKENEKPADNKILTKSNFDSIENKENKTKEIKSDSKIQSQNTSEIKDTKNNDLKKPLEIASEIANDIEKNTKDEKENTKLSSENEATLLANQGNFKESKKESNLESNLESQNNKTQKSASLGVKNTLKYGAFSAFDALSLLKPSDGKKLSELIKKADELSLNLEKIKYQKIQNPKITKDKTLEKTHQAKEANETKLESKPLEAKNKEESNKNINEKDINENTKMDNKEPLKKALNETNAITKPQDTSSPKDNAKEMPQNKQDSPRESKINNETKETKSQTTNQATNQTASQTSANHKESTKNQDLKEQNPLEITKETNIEQKAEEKTMVKPVNFKLAKDNQPKTNEIQVTQTPFTQEANMLKNEQMERIFDSKEVMKNFVSNLRQEILNSKPPISKITLELTPANLGSVEVSIIHQGKNIQVQLNATQSTLNLFIQNQSELRAALNQIGYENITMSFSNGSQMGFSDNQGKWSYAQNDKNNAFGNENSLDNENVNNFEITIINNYA